MVKTKEKLVLIDSHALIHRAYHALPPMHTKEGVPTNAVYGFILTLLKVLSSLKPTYVVAAFDMKGPTFRHEAYKEYKAHRKAAEDDLVAQFPLVKDVVEAFNIPIIEKQGFEADDVVGTLTAKYPGISKVIVTGDADALQLVDEETKVFTLRRGVKDTVIYDVAGVKDKYGFLPEHVPDYKGLCGDASDNIPGVAGVGDKTARDLVAKYGSIEKIYENIEELPKRARTRLEDHKKEALFSRDLATIRRDVPVEMDLEDARMEDYGIEEVRELFEKFGFKSLLARLPKSSRGEMQATLLSNDQSPNQNSEKIPNSQYPISLPEGYFIADSEEKVKELKKKLGKVSLTAFDTENDYLGAREYPIVGMSFAFEYNEKSEAWYVPVTPESVKEWKDVLENPKLKKTGHNLKYDYAVLAQSRIKLAPIVFDTMVGAYLLDPGRRQYGMDALAMQELSHHCIPITDLIGSGKDPHVAKALRGRQKKMSEVPLAELARYAAEDADVSLRLYNKFHPEIESAGLRRVMDELEMPLIPILSEMEMAGVRLDVDRLSVLSKKNQKRIEELREDIWKEAGEEFNVNSTVQLRKILYEKLQLPTTGIKRTQSGYSTAADELNKLRGTHAIIELLEEYRELTKLQNTYIETLPELVDGETGRVHTSFNQTVTATGRLSSDSPNLQNIPVRTELGQEIRAAFVADAGCVLVKADYSQIELRLAAHMSQDEKMLDAFRSGEDIHRATAAWVFEVKPEDVTDEQRRAAKTLNFGVLYGMGAFHFARASGVSVEEARSFIERYRKQYAGVSRMIEQYIANAEELGYTETLFGRRRYVPEINSHDPGTRAAAERAAYNFPLQGTAADLLKKAMIELSAVLAEKYPKARMVLTVHDELVVEVLEEEASAVAKLMREVMEGVYTLDVPLVVDVGVGKNWRDVEKVG